MKSIKAIITRPISSDRADSQFGELACYAGALFISVVGLRGVTKLDSSQMELIMGTLLVSILAMLSVVAGMIMNLKREIQQVRERNDPRP